MSCFVTVFLAPKSQAISKIDSMLLYHFFSLLILSLFYAREILLDSLIAQLPVTENGVS